MAFGNLIARVYKSTANELLERHGTEVISTEELMHKIYTANTKIAERVRTWEVNKDRELRGREKPEI